MIDKKLQDLSTFILERAGFPLFNSLPIEELESLKKDVDDEDRFRARLSDLCNLIDRINKKDIDKFIGVKTQGSRTAFINLVKKLFPDEHNFIDERVDRPLGMTFLLRDYLTHRRNINAQKAYDFFELSDPIKDNRAAWERVIYLFNQLIDDVVQLLKRQPLAHLTKQEEIEQELKEVLDDRLVKKYRYVFEEENAKKLLLYILAEKNVVDSELAKKFKMEVSELRELLLPLIPDILRVRYLDNNSTEIEIKDYALEILKDYYHKE